MNDLRKNYLKNGYVIIKNFFSKEKIIETRESLIRDKIINSEIFENIKIEQLFLKNEFFKLFKDILGCKKLLYFSDSSVSIHEKIENCPSGYHVDSRNEDFDFKKEYPIARAGIYLQNVSDFSGGVKIRPGSHNSYCITNFKQSIRNIITEKIVKKNSNFNLNLFHKNFQPDLDVGDLIIWNLRLHHSGASWRYKINKNFSLPPFIDNLMPKFTKIKPQFEKNRTAVFIAFANGDITDKNVSNYINRKLKEKKTFKDFKNLRKKFLEHNVLILNEM